MQQKFKYDQVVAEALDFIKEKLKLKNSSQSHYRIGWSLLKEFMDAHEVSLTQRSRSLEPQ